MLAKMYVVLMAAVAMFGQRPGGLADRIRRAPLPEEQRQALSAAYSEKAFARMEAILKGSVLAEAPPASAAELQALLGALEFVGGRMNQAVHAFQRSESLKPLDDHDRFTLAMAQVNLGDVKGSRVELTRLNENHPDQPIYLYWLARLDYGQRLYDEAVEKLNKVIRLDPNSVRGYDNLGLSFDMMGFPDEAQGAFAKAVDLNRKLAAPSPWPPQNLGYLMLRLEKFHEAEEYLREALKYDPRFALAHYHLGRVLEREDNDDAAIVEYRSAAALDDKIAEPLYSLGRLYLRHGRAVEAESVLAEYTRRRALAVDAPYEAPAIETRK
jgi:tetratricopeptide (TPR) repeat protein